MSASDMGVVLPGELVDFIESGVMMLVGTRDAKLRPECVRAVGATVAADRRTIHLFLNDATSQRTIANLRAGSPIAVCFNRAVDHQSVQVKGMPLAVRAPAESERGVTRHYLSSFTEALYQVGMARSLSRQLRVEPCTVVDLDIRELFQQTPGPEAGQPLVRS